MNRRQRYLQVSLLFFYFIFVVMVMIRLNFEGDGVITLLIFYCLADLNFFEFSLAAARTEYRSRCFTVHNNP